MFNRDPKNSWQAFFCPRAMVLRVLVWQAMVWPPPDLNNSFVPSKSSALSFDNKFGNTQGFINDVTQKSTLT